MCGAAVWFVVGILGAVLQLCNQQTDNDTAIGQTKLKHGGGAGMLTTSLVSVITDR